MNKKWLILVLSIITIVIIFIFYMDLINITSYIDGKKKLIDIIFKPSIFNLNKNLMIIFLFSIISTLTTILAVLGTYYFTNKNASDMILEQRKIFEQEQINYKNAITKEERRFRIKEENYQNELALQKEVAYKNMNKANSDNILKEIKILHENITYLNVLVTIEEQLCLYEIFNDEYKKIFKISNEFVKKLKSDFYYDNNIVKIIENILSIDVENRVLVDSANYYVEYANNLYFYFYENDNINNETAQYLNIKKKAILTLWSKLFSYKDKHDSLYPIHVLYFLNNDLHISQGLDEESIQVINFLHENNYELKNLYSKKNLKNSKYKSFLNKSPLNDKVKDFSSRFDLNEIVQLYGDIYYAKFNNRKIIDQLGKNNEELIKFFVQKFLKSFESGKVINTSPNFIKEYKYIY